MKRVVSALLCLAGLSAVASARELVVAKNGRYLEDLASGRPFLYLGDTAWELFHRLDREQADRYLRDRARKGFTVIQAVALAELDGLDTPNVYADVIWILGGDRNPENEEHLAVIRALAKGLAAGDNGRHLMTFHPQGGSSSAEWFHADEWLDFDMFQSGHGQRLIPNHETTRKTRSLAPAKPVLDGEPCYEDHPVGWKVENGWFDEWDVRRAAYASMLSGAAGHTYGDHNIWQMWQVGREPISAARTPWYEALDHPASLQMGFLRRFFEARPFHTLVPDQLLVVGTNPPGADQVSAARAEDGAFILAYVPTGRPVTLRVEHLRSGRARAWWYNPRQHAAQAAGEHTGSATLSLTPPSAGRNNDWVLVLDDAARELPPPAPSR